MSDKAYVRSLVVKLRECVIPEIRAHMKAEYVSPEAIRDVSQAADLLQSLAAERDAAHAAGRKEALEEGRAAPAGAVKPLEWDGRRTTGVMFQYRIHVGYGLSDGFFALTLSGSTIGEYSSEEDAKAAADADYERRILSALSPQPPLSPQEAAKVLMGMDQETRMKAWRSVSGAPGDFGKWFAQALRAIAGGEAQ